MNSQANTKVRPDRRLKPRPVFIAAVRFLDGRRELFAVKNAIDAADARETVLSELIDAATVVVAQRH